jgi:hypothetical protein
MIILSKDQNTSAQWKCVQAHSRTLFLIPSVCQCPWATLKREEQFSACLWAQVRQCFSLLFARGSGVDKTLRVVRVGSKILPFAYRKRWYKGPCMPLYSHGQVQRHRTPCCLGSTWIRFATFSRLHLLEPYPLLLSSASIIHCTL